MKKNKSLAISASLFVHLLIFICVLRLASPEYLTPPSTTGMEIDFLPQVPQFAAVSKVAPAPQVALSKGELNLASSALATTRSNSKAQHKKSQSLDQRKASPAGIKPTDIIKPADILKPAGQAEKTDSSSDGIGSESTPFDIRVVEYGHAAALAIQGNIVRPETYRYLDVTFRAYVTLDQNMQFVTARIIQSTGSDEYDQSIMQALRVTIYPPLPPGADWRRYHELDFYIK